MIPEKENIGTSIINYGLKPLLAKIELCYRIGLLHELIQKFNNNDYNNCFDLVSILFNYSEIDKELYNNENNKNSYLTFFRLLNDLRYYPKNIDSKKYLNSLNKILEYYLEQLVNNLKILEIEDNSLTVSNDSLYYQIFNNFKIIVLNFMHNIVNNKINHENKKNIGAMSKVLLNIYSSLVHSYTILFSKKYDYDTLKELESEFANYFVTLKDVLESLNEGKEINDELANQCVYNYEAINSSMNLEANIEILCFGGKNDEYKRIRECLLSRR